MSEKALMSAQDIDRALIRVAHEIIEHNKGARNLVLIGIHTRGVPMARRLGALIAQIEGCPVCVGELDIGRHREHYHAGAVPERAL